MILGRRFAGAVVAAVAIVVGVAVGVSGFASTANAATAYRYWTYYVALPDTTAWVYSQRGPATEHPQDGEVQGWRFAVQADRSGGLTPRTAPVFAKLCGAQQPQSGKARVGIVLDFGVADDAPAGERPPAGVVTGCVQVPDGANGVDVLDAAVGAGNVRIGQGLICGINGYPKSECADVVAAPKPAASKSATSKAAVATEKPAVASTAKAPATPGATPAPSASASPTLSAAAKTVVPSASAGAPPPSPSATASVSSLGDLKEPSHNGFPVGAVVGGVLVAGLGIAAAVRAAVTRR